jgi:hypothetical protein
VSAPDYISPIVAYRLWQWDASGLKSLNGVPWVAGQPLTARCGVLRRGKFVGLPAHPDHNVPQTDCRCGVYASKILDTLRSMCFWDWGVRGEVFLWGTVVEHQHGWRAQFAYPKSLHVPSDILPATLAEIRSRFQSLVAYGCDIFILHDGGSVPIWGKDSGLDPAGLDFLMSRGKDWYARRRRTLKRGDCVAIGGRGIAVVEHADDMRVHAVLGKREWVRLLRRDIAWNDTYSRWEASVSA